jgi:hypothetical protein
MKRSAFLLILAAGVLSLLYGIVTPLIVISYRNKLRRAENDLERSESQLQATPRGLNPNGMLPGGALAQTDPAREVAARRYRQAIASAQDLLARAPYRAGLILTDITQCPAELHDFAWRWTARQLPHAQKVLYDGNCHAAVQSTDGKTLAVRTEVGDKIVVVDLSPGQRPPFTLPEFSRNFTLSPDGSHLAVFSGGGTITLYTVADRAKPPVELDNAGPEIGFSADGSTIVSASLADEKLTRWRRARRLGAPDRRSRRAREPDLRRQRTWQGDTLRRRHGSHPRYRAHRTQISNDCPNALWTIPGRHKARHGSSLGRQGSSANVGSAKGTIDLVQTVAAARPGRSGPAPGLLSRR